MWTSSYWFSLCKRLVWTRFVVQTGSMLISTSHHIYIHIINTLYIWWKGTQTPFQMIVAMVDLMGTKPFISGKELKLFVTFVTPSLSFQPPSPLLPSSHETWDEGVLLTTIFSSQPLSCMKCKTEGFFQPNHHSQSLFHMKCEMKGFWHDKTESQSSEEAMITRVRMVLCHPSS